MLNGTPFDYSLTLFVAVNGPVSVPPNFPGYFNTQGTANYGNTVLLTDLSFADEFGAPISGALMSQGGLTYTAVPEPSSLLLMAGAAAGLCSVRRRRAARRSAARGLGGVLKVFNLAELPLDHADSVCGVSPE